MKYIAPTALALMLGACAHECNCAAPAPEAAEIMEPVELDVAEPEVEEVVAEEVIIEEAAPAVEEVEAIVEIETAPAATTVVPAEGSTARRVVTRRLVEEHDAGTPTAPAMDGSAADDPLLSETPRVLEDTTFDTPSVPDDVEDAVDAMDGGGQETDG